MNAPRVQPSVIPIENGGYRIEFQPGTDPEQVGFYIQNARDISGVQNVVREGLSFTIVVHNEQQLNARDLFRILSLDPDYVSPKEIGEAAREVCQERYARHDEQSDLEGTTPQAIKEIWNELGGMDFLGITVPKEFGGLGLGYEHHVAFAEQLSEALGGQGLAHVASSNLFADNLRKRGTQGQKEEFLPGLCRGEYLCGLAMTEENGGTDVFGGMECTAIIDEAAGTARLNGKKKWITNPNGKALIVYAVTRVDERGRKHCTPFIVRKDETGRKGFTTSVEHDKVGVRASETGELFFDDYTVSLKEDILGGIDNLHEGRSILLNGLNTERVILAAAAIGRGYAAYRTALAYVEERKQFGKPIGEFQLVQQYLANMQSALESARSLVYDTARWFDRNPMEKHNSEVAAVHSGNVFFTAAQNSYLAANQAFLCMGANGFVRKGPHSAPQRAIRDLQLYLFGGGSLNARILAIGANVQKPDIDINAF